MNDNALFNLMYGLYVVTSNDGSKDNALIVNSVCQLTDNPTLVAVTINKSSYSHDVIKQTKKLNVCPLTEKAPFSLFSELGFKSGREYDKLKDFSVTTVSNGLCILNEYINSYLCLEVVSYTDLPTHGMFICKVTENKVLNNETTMTYSYYTKNVKPKKQAKGYVCTICGYVHESDTLDEDFICPWCNHGAQYFKKL